MDALLDLAQNTLDGLTSGAAYALLAVGFTLIFGVLRRANLAYGACILFGVYLATWLSQRSDAGLATLALVAVAGCVLAGAYVERLCFAPHRERRGNRITSGAAIAAMVASFALWMQFEEAATLLLPRHMYAFPALYEGAPLALGPLSVRVEALVLFAAAALMLGALWFLLKRSRFGIAVRALIDDPLAAGLCGIPVARVFAVVFGLASAIGGAAGFFVVAMHQQVTPHLGMWATLKGMLAMMIGGLGSLPGAVFGGLLLGLIEAHSQWYLGPQSRDLIAYLLLFTLLALRPGGLASWMTRWTSTRSAS
ncbi:MAG: branched-chain amino acid ABC transporter permease [Burkholderiales bacterium]|nr:branched-chain amino acid ABC transporter permease [Burkholderiales bacterium]